MTSENGHPDPEQSFEQLGGRKIQFPRHSRKDLCTGALYRYLRRHFLIFDFFFFGIHLATAQDSMGFTAAKALAENGSEADQARLERWEANKQPTFKKLQSFGEFQSENICIRSVDNFLAYISETIQMCMKSRPEMLRSREMISIEDVLRFGEYDSLIEFLVERKINELSYGGIREVNSFLTDRTGINLWSSDEERSLLGISVELRNLYTHNRGVVNDTFLRKTKGASHSYQFIRGKRFHADFDEIVTLTNNMFTISVRLDCEVSNKYDLPRREYESWGGLDV